MSPVRRQTRRRPAPAKPPRRPVDRDIPPIPAVRSDSDPAPAVATPEETEAEDRVRRMVEAAYT